MAQFPCNRVVLPKKQNFSKFLLSIETFNFEINQKYNLIPVSVRKKLHHRIDGHIIIDIFGQHKNNLHDQTLRENKFIKKYF
jgi:hypothetical protein